MSQEKAPRLLGEMKSFLRRAALGDVAPRGAVDAGEFYDEKNGSGIFPNSAVDLCTAASMAIGFFAARWPSENARLVTSDVEANSSGDAACRLVVKQKNDPRPTWFQSKIGVTPAP